MPQNTPMKRQFTTIDGRTVMSNLPQHWKGDDWAITGVDNPLPVGNYVQTDAGVWIPQKGSDDGAADVRLTGSNVKQITLNFDRDDNSIQTQIITPPAGKIWRVKRVNFRARSNADTGNITAWFYTNNITMLDEYLSLITKGSTKDITVRNNMLISGGLSPVYNITDVDHTLLQTIFTGISIGADLPLSISLYNETGVSLTNAELSIVVEEV